jgi:hypothetical protein
LTCSRVRWTQLFALAVATALILATTASASELAPGGSFTDDNGNLHEGYIEAINAAGITAGCDESGNLYCPDGVVTRGQMASFLARALDLPPAELDYFDDDAGSPHEENINAIAAAGITLGISEGVFDPGGVVPRDQMASFLARAIPGLVPASVDAFSDDDGNTHEDSINVVAANEISLGCDDDEYCPNEPVRRDQMASFLGRALGLEELVPPPLEIPLTGTLTEDQARALFSLYFAPEDVEDAIVIAQCESNLIVDIVSANGKYGGLFQHALSAWDARAASVGFAGAPYSDPYANAAAAAALKGAGPWSPHWPGCSDLLD